MNDGRDVRPAQGNSAKQVVNSNEVFKYLDEIREVTATLVTFDDRTGEVIIKTKYLPKKEYVKLNIRIVQ